MGALYPSSVKASHLNMILCKPPTWSKEPLASLQHAMTSATPADIAGFARSSWFMQEGWGYNRVQSTKPQTIGYALADSPVALLAWIYEKLHDWTDGYPWTEDEICTWVSLYWFSTAGPAASVRIYYESMHRGLAGLRFVHKDQVTDHVPYVKYGLARFPKELRVVPRSWTSTIGNVVLYSDNETGGHFAATEQPEAIARDLVSMFGKGGGAFGCVKGRDGYERKAKL